MRAFDNIKVIFVGLLYLFLQVVVFKELSLFDTGFFFIYILLLLLLPLELGSIALLFIGFFTGLLIDIFYNSPGIHASACVLMMFLRSKWVNVITPQGGYDSGAQPLIRNMGFNWFMTYILPLILAHHLLLFYIEAAGFQNFWNTLYKVMFSFVLNTVLIVIIQFLFYSNKSRA